MIEILKHGNPIVKNKEIITMSVKVLKKQKH